ncbi:hypothetical protein Q4574_13525 [Aliiglaciecola sp. 3_MG-2023]|uniref:hypothetical protein n=1 Tax=Aliiglaciecola sp. 3_MG-2023 TaxID=3062644 RepID=UPI0026E42F50|nr:hypothetical protein [Aliiglaciecola sp. 3_MG-2023]MDO6694309.1 hypothetical protein [Aliiglaciecola sp. 3_MG-2023]
MKVLALILFISTLVSACSKQLTVDTLYASCKDKNQYSIVNYMAQFQVLNDISGEELLGLFDGKTSKTESVDLCQCFVSKFTKQSIEVQNQTLAKIQSINEQLKPELKLFAKKGVLGRMSYRDEYQKIEGFMSKIENVKRLIRVASENKFQQQRCL